jgi:hypothetical protein
VRVVGAEGRRVAQDTPRLRPFADSSVRVVGAEGRRHRCDLDDAAGEMNDVVNDVVGEIGCFLSLF